MSKKYDLKEDFDDTFFYFKNHNTTPVKVFIIVIWFVVLASITLIVVK